MNISNFAKRLLKIIDNKTTNQSDDRSNTNNELEYLNSTKNTFIHALKSLESNTNEFTELSQKNPVEILAKINSSKYNYTFWDKISSELPNLDLNFKKITHTNTEVSLSKADLLFLSESNKDVPEVLWHMASKNEKPTKNDAEKYLSDFNNRNNDDNILMYVEKESIVLNSRASMQLSNQYLREFNTSKDDICKFLTSVSQDSDLAQLVVSSNKPNLSKRVSLKF
jgi:hypothetical protein